MFGHTFSAADIPDLKGKVAIVTGANTGIGKICVIELARSDTSFSNSKSLTLKLCLFFCLLFLLDLSDTEPM